MHPTPDVLIVMCIQTLVLLNVSRYLAPPVTPTCYFSSLHFLHWEVQTPQCSLDTEYEVHPPSKETCLWEIPAGVLSYTSQAQLRLTTGYTFNLCTSIGQPARPSIGLLYN
jgi:hypothetical protein